MEHFDLKQVIGEIEKIKAEDERKGHILVVDDDVRTLRFLKAYLRDYEVATAVNGSQAMKFLETKKTDLILLDYKMPVENGPEVLKKLRANERTKDIPVVFLTGVADSDKIQEVLLMKPQGYLLKPINRGKLMEIIKKVI